MDCHAPGVYAFPDNQGCFRTCTRFVSGRSIDISQEVATTALLNIHQDTLGKWPKQFHNKKFHFIDNWARYWDTHLQIQELPSVYDFPTESQRIGNFSQYT